MEKKYNSISEFVEKYNDAKSSVVKNGMIQSIEVEEYIPYENKSDICRSIVSSTFYDVLMDDDRNVLMKSFKRNSVAEYMMYWLFIADLYSNIKVNHNDGTNEFNLINKPFIEISNDNGEPMKVSILDIITSKIPNRELTEFKMVLEMTKDDVVKNEYEINGFVNNQVGRIVDVLKPFLESAKPFIDRLNNMEDSEIDKLKGSLKKLTNKFME